MATNVGTLTATLTANAAKFNNAMDQAAGRVDRLQGAFKALSVASAAVGGVIAGVAGVAIKAASAQRDAELRLASAIRGSGKAIDADRIKAYAAELQKLTQFGDEQTISAAAMLATFQLTEDQIVGLLPRVQNMAALYGMDLRTAALTVGRAMTYGAGALSRYGITLSDAEKQAFKFGNQQQKINILMAALDKNTGPAAELLASTATGAMVQFKNALGDLAEQLGFILDTPVADFLRGLTTKLQAATEWFAGLSDKTKEWIGKATAAALAISGIGVAIGGLGLVLPAVLTVLGSMAVAAAAVVIPMLAVAAGVAGVILIVGALKKAWVDNLGGVRGAVIKFVDGAKESFKAMLKWLKDAWAKATGWISEKLILAYSFVTGKSADEAHAIIAEMNKAGGSLLDPSDTASDFAKIGGQAKAFTLQLGTDLKDTFTEGLAVFGDGLNALKLKLGLGGGGGAKPKKPKFGGSGGAVEASTELDDSISEFLRRRNEDRERALDQAEQRARAQDERTAQQAENAAGMAAGLAVEAFGELGTVFSNTVRGFEQGGFIGAIAAFVGSLLSKAPGFENLLSEMSNLFRSLVQSFEPVLSAVIVLVRVNGVLLKPAFEMIGKSLQALRPTLVFLFNILKSVAQFVLTVFEKLAGIWNWIVEKLAKFVGWIKGSWGDTVRKAKINTKGLREAKAALDNIEFGQAATAVDGMADAANEATKSLLNLPSGYKYLELARFGSTAAQGGSGSTHGAGSGGGTTTNIENVWLPAANPEEFQQALETGEGWRNFNRTGTPVRTSGPYSGRTQVK